MSATSYQTAAIVSRITADNTQFIQTLGHVEDRLLVTVSAAQRAGLAIHNALITPFIAFGAISIKTLQPQISPGLYGSLSHLNDVLEPAT